MPTTRISPSSPSKLRPGVTWSDGIRSPRATWPTPYNMLIENGNTKKNLRQAVQVAQRVKQCGCGGRSDRAHRAFASGSAARVPVSSPSYFAYGLFWVPEHIWREVEDKAAFTYFDLDKRLAVDHGRVESGECDPERGDLRPGAMTGGVRRPDSGRCRRRSASSPCPMSRASASRSWRCRMRWT